MNSFIIDVMIGNKFERMMRILNLLSEYRWTTAAELAEELQVSNRTILRYMRDINIPFEERGVGLVESSKEGYRLRDTRFLDQLKRIDDQIILAAIQTSPFGKSLKSINIHNEDLSEKINSHLKQVPYIDEDIIDKILDALVQNRLLTIIYSKENGLNKSYSVLPFKVISNSGNLYLQCFCFSEGYNKILTFIISKITEVHLSNKFTDGHFIKEKMEYINSRWGTFVSDTNDYKADIVFEVDAALEKTLVVNPLHESLKYCADYGKHSFKIKVHNALEFVRWTLRYGHLITIREPEWVINLLLGELESIKNRYN